MNCRLHLRYAFFALLLPMAAMAQIPGLSKPDPAPAEEKSEAPATIPIANIPLKAEEDERFIQEAMLRAQSSNKAGAMAKQLKDIQNSVSTLSQKSQSSKLEGVQISRLESLDRHWSFLNRELTQWQGRLQSVAKPLSEDAAELAARKQIWINTRTATAATLAPPLLRSMDELLVEFEKADQTISQPLTKLLDLGRDASIIQARVSRNLAAVRAQIAAVDRDLAVIDSENLFAALAASQADETGNLESLKRGFSIEADFRAEFDRANSRVERLFWIYSFILLPLFIWLAYSARKLLKGDSRLEQYRKTLTRPFSAWLLLTIMGLLILQLSGPLIRVQLLLLLAWLPVMRLQPQHVHDGIGRWMYLTAVFYVINLLAFLLSQNPLLFRLTVLFNGLLMLVTLAWLLYRSRTALKARTNRQLFVLRIIIGVGTAVMLVAVVSNLIGNVTLAAMLTDAALDTAYMGLFLFAVGNVVRAFSRFLFRGTAEKLKSRTQHAGGLMEVMSGLFNFVLVALWLYGALTVFRIFRPLMALVHSISSFAIEFGNISITIGSIVLFGVSVYLSFWLAKTIRGVLSEDILPNMELPRGVANSISSLSYYALLVSGLMVALAAAGFHISQLALILGALSVGIGLGLQDVVKNFVSGLILMVERPVQPGDIVEVSNTTGKVRDIGMRATTLTTFEGADVIVPNGMLLSEKMINWTLSSDNRRIDISIGVSYAADPKHVLEVLMAVANKAHGVTHNPSPTVVFTGFGPHSLDFSVRAWTDNYDDAIFIRSALAVDIHAALTEAGIAIPFPQRDLHLRSVDPDILSQLQRSTP
ncbi:MAG: mechanosensitive ion channel domain-containing protein [Arenimonas sp.]